MNFEKYQHVERLSHSAVEGITTGTCHVFPKIDGTNASVWLNRDGTLGAGSRNRTLSLDNDNHGFCRWVQEGDHKLRVLLDHFPYLRLFGEWLVPHSLKTYREDAWRDFYIFDVLEKDDGYVPYTRYSNIFESTGITYIPCMAVIKDGTTEQFLNIAERNDYLMQPGEIGEGLVIKNYDFTNKFGHTTWAKIVRSEFKEKHCRTMGPPNIQGAYTVERDISNTYVTQALVDKERAKIDTNPVQPRLLSTVYHCILTEELGDIVKKMKNPTIDFKQLQRCVTGRVKELARDLF